MALDRLFGRDLFVNEIVWCYAVGRQEPARLRPQARHDPVVRARRRTGRSIPTRCACRGAAALTCGSLPRPEGPIQEKTDRKTGRVYRYPVAAGKVPEDWWTDVETLNHSDRERTGWPSQKPERLIARILAAVTRPGDRVADWFAGSGTTAAVAQRLGRRFVVVEREAAAVAIVETRLAAQRPTLVDVRKTLHRHSKSSGIAFDPERLRVTVPRVKILWATR